MDAIQYLRREMAAERVTDETLVQLVRAYQARVGLKIDGKLGPDTRAALHAETTDVPTPAVEVTDDGSEDLAPEPALPNLDLAPSEWLEGVDVSRYQTNVNWEQVRDSGIRFVFAKATEGRTYVDPTFRSTWQRLQDVGLVRGAYHFMRPDNNSAVDEAKHAVDVVGKLGAGDLPLVGDLEVPRPNLAPRQLVEWVNTWCSTVEALTGRPPILYTYTSYWIDQLGSTKELSHWPLWLADYRLPAPDRPAESLGGWRWLFWQWTGKGRVFGYDHDIDRNVFRGTLNQLRQLARLSPASMPAEVLAPEPAAALSAARPLRLRALDWCLREAERWGSSRVNDARIAEYLSGCVRNGKKLGLKSGNFCAAAMGFAEHQVAREGERVPPWRAGAREPMRDAKAGLRGRWIPIGDVLQGGERPLPGALAVYWRGAPHDWRGHIERVVSASNNDFVAIGANESGTFGTGGRWVLETTPYTHPQLLGFVVDDEHPMVHPELPEPPDEFRET